MDTSREFICDNNLPQTDWRIDYSNKDSIHNWVDPEKLNLTCVRQDVLGLIGSMYFAGFVVASTFVPQQADRFGRKPVLIIDLVVQTVVYVLMFVSKNIYFTIALTFCLGFCAPGRAMVTATYMNEFVQEKHRSYLTTGLNIADASVMIAQASFYLIEPNWVPIHLTGLIGAIIILGLDFLLPESPKWYFSNHNYAAARI